MNIKLPLSDLHAHVCQNIWVREGGGRGGEEEGGERERVCVRVCARVNAYFSSGGIKVGAGVGNTVEVQAS